MEPSRRSQNVLYVRPIITLALLASVLVSAPARGEDGAGAERALPALGNTAAGDRPLLREVADDQVYRDDALARGADIARDDATAARADDPWTRIARSRRLEIPDSDAVRAFVRRYRAEALWVDRILARATPWLAHLIDALDASFLPLELALLPAIESGYRPHATSPDGALGLWQFVPDTAREIGIARDAWYDGRADTVAATRAAVDYLGYLNALFHGDWSLTLAAYNAGPGRVRAALRHNLERGLPGDFDALALPRETREYVPKLYALVALLREHPDGPFDLPRVAAAPAFERVELGRRVGLAEVAALGGLSARTLERLNAGLLHGITPPEGPHALYVPSGSGERLRAALARAPGRRLAPTPPFHEVAAGDTLGAIARRYGLDLASLAHWNALDGTLIRVGQRLRLQGASRTVPVTAPRRVEHVVEPGETLSGIATRYAVGLDAISRADGSARGAPLEGELIRPGERLLVHLAVAGAG